MRAGTITAVGRFRAQNVTMIAPGDPFGGTRASRDIPRYAELIESGLLDSATMISRRRNTTCTAFG